MIKYASEVVIFILVRIDSPERARNLDLTLSHLYGTGIRIEVWEIDAEQKYQLKLSSERIFYHFVFDCDPVFHRTLYWDSLFKKSKYPVVGIWDADIIVEYWQIEEAVRRVVEGDSVLCLPYNGVVKALSSKASQEYARCGRTVLWTRHPKEAIRLMGRPSTGGAVLMNRIIYLSCGGENKNFYGWGPEDAERVHRVEILGYSVSWVSGGPLFHLYHPRSYNSWYISEEQGVKNRNEFVRVCNMSRQELEEYYHGNRIVVIGRIGKIGL